MNKELKLPLNDGDIAAFKQQSAKMRTLYTKLDYAGRGVILALMVLFVLIYDNKGWAAVVAALFLGMVLFLFYKFQLPIICMNRSGITYRYNGMEIQGRWDGSELVETKQTHACMEKALWSELGRKPLEIEVELMDSER